MSVVSRLSVVPFFLCAFLMSYSYGQIAAQFDDCGSPGSSTVPYCIDSHVVERLRLLLLQLQDDIVFMACNASLSAVPSTTTALLSFGACSGSRWLNSAPPLHSEGFALYGGIYSKQSDSGFYILGVQGRPLEPDPFALHKNQGVHFGAYALLEQLGYAFLHPLRPLVPSTVQVPSKPISVVEAPRWPVRNWHYHTEHPLELTEFFLGFPSNGTEWKDMIGEAELFMEWLVANRQNRLEWVLLWAKPWEDFANSTVRQSRLKTINSLLHNWGLAAGFDMPIAMKQQHAWFMTEGRGTLEQQTTEIYEHLKWSFDAGFDFLSTESGYSEFTHPNCTKMLQWINITSELVHAKFENKKSYIKCHCSTSQFCNEYEDPFTGGPLNFNFLPAYANEYMGVLAHTVQYYSFFDPAPTYGNENFTYMFEFMIEEANHRESIYFGETAYWVNYDIDVPLFLPYYAKGRLTDLRAAANAEEQLDVNIGGQVNFGSGWEWGYWLQDVATCRASWNPGMKMNFEDALRDIFQPALAAFGAAAEELWSIVADMIDLQQQLLVFGNVTGMAAPTSVIRRNGQAYIQGWDTWSELESIFDASALTQPAKMGINQVRLHLDGKDGFPSYQGEIQPLLSQMASNFTTIAERLANLNEQIPEDAQWYYQSLLDSANMTALRATQVYALYDYAWGFLHKSPGWRNSRLQVAEKAMIAAMECVARRESQYLVPVNRIAGWRKNPTAYGYGYVWTVHSLYYFWRDYSRATNTSLEVLTPCFMNIIDFVDVGLGEGPVYHLEHVLQKLLDSHHLKDIGECLSQPPSEPHYPLTPFPLSNKRGGAEDQHESFSLTPNEVISIFPL